MLKGTLGYSNMGNKTQLLSKNTYEKEKRKVGVIAPLVLELEAGKNRDKVPIHQQGK